MNRYKKVSLAFLFTLLIIAILENMAGLATAAQMPGSTYQNQFLPFHFGLITSTVILVVGGAFFLSDYILGSKNKKDLYVLFVFLSAIFISIIVWGVSAYLFTSGTL